MDQEKVGQFIKNIRVNNKLTQLEFAQKYGVTYQAVSNWEHGKNLPDIALLKQISIDFNVSMDELLEGNKKSKKKKYLLIGGLIILVLGILGIAFYFHDDDFEFKTITSNCNNFNISGSIAYNNKKTSIFINNVTYCGGNDETEYSNIECVLYESENDIEKKISTCDYRNNKSIKLEDYLKDVEITIDDYQRSCNIFSNETFYLRINATDNNGKITTYKIPLSLQDTCEK